MKNRGIVSLATVLVIALFLFSIGILMGVQSGSSVFSGFAGKNAEIAQALAEAGVQDATLKLARDSDYEGSYILTQSDGSTIDISVTTGSPVVIVATSTVSQALGVLKRSLRASVTIDSNGVITAVTKVNQ